MATITRQFSMFSHNLSRNDVIGRSLKAFSVTANKRTLLRDRFGINCARWHDSVFTRTNTSSKVVNISCACTATGTMFQDRSYQACSRLKVPVGLHNSSPSSCADICSECANSHLAQCQSLCTHSLVLFRGRKKWTCTNLSPLFMQTSNFHSKPGDGQDHMGLDPLDSKKLAAAEENSAWMVRLASENGYLSWCRNVYIATVCIITLHLQDFIPCAKDVSLVFFIMAGLNLVTGTATYIHQLVVLRKKMLMSTFNVFCHVILAITHVLLWFAAVGIYVGIIQDDESEAIQEQPQIEMVEDGYIIEINSGPKT